MNMDGTKVQIGDDVLLDVGINSDWYISSVGYEYGYEEKAREVTITLRNKGDENKLWRTLGELIAEPKDEPRTEVKIEPSWVGETYGHFKDEPQTDIHGLTDCDFCKEKNCEDCEGGKDEPQTGAYKCPKCGKDTPIEFDECVWCLSPKDEPLTKCDLCKREGDDICLDCERKKQSGKE